MSIADKAAALAGSIMQFGSAIDAAKEDEIPLGSASTYRRGDETWAELNKAAVGLPNVDNTSDANKPVSAAQALKIEQEVSKSSPVGLKGTVPFVKQHNSRESELDYLVLSGQFVVTAAELAEAQTRVIGMATVFNDWYRFSHNNTSDQPANATEITQWSYDAVNDVIKSTVNSATYIGFVSTKKYDQYLLETRLSSINADDDTVGVVIAFAVDANGREHTLSALRCIGGNGYTWRLVYNLARTDTKVIADKTSEIKWGNGAYGATAAVSGYLGNQGFGWDDFPTGTLVKVERTGDTIKAITSDFGSDTYVASSEIVVDLTTDPVLSIFRGPAKYGFSALSQMDAVFKVLQFSETDNIVFDLSANKVYTHNGTAWVEDTARTPSSAIGVGRLLYNPYTGRTFFMGESETLGIGSKTPKDLNAAVSGKPTASQWVLRHICAFKTVVPANCVGSFAISETAATAQTVFNIFKNATQVGTLTFAAGQTQGVFAMVAGQTLQPGDVFKIQAPASADAALADIAIVIAASQEL